MQSCQVAPATRILCRQPGSLTTSKPFNPLNSLDLCNPCHRHTSGLYCHRKPDDMPPKPECLGHSEKLQNGEREGMEGERGGCQRFPEVGKCLFLRHFRPRNRRVFTQAIHT